MIQIYYKLLALSKIFAKKYDLSNLVQWLRAKKITLNNNKTDIITFWSPRKQIT